MTTIINSLNLNNRFSVKGRRLAFLAAFLPCIVLMVSSCETRQQEENPEIQLTDLELETLEGKPFDLSSLEGKRVFINFWATWCRPCLEEMPSIERAQQELTGENVVFLLATDEEIDQINSFRKKRDFNFTYVRVRSLEALSIQALPTTLIFGTDGELTFAEAGYRDWSLPENIRLINP